jgi:diguanylate cyclase (GGDEF)-like protein
VNSVGQNIFLLVALFLAGTYSSVLTYWLLRRHLAHNLGTGTAPPVAEDAMTRVFSSDTIRQFFELKRAKAAQPGKDPEPISFILLDIDNFKRINTQFGMEGGDRLVSEVAGLLKANTRGADDALFRYKLGDEFLILCYGATGTIAGERIAPRISELISKHDYYLSASSDEVNITVSISVTEYHHGETFDQMIRRLESALRKAKLQKNQIVLL